MAIVIQGGHILDPGRFNGIGDLVLDNGKIAAIGPEVRVPPAATKFSAKGRLVVPGFVDLHVHFREPGFEYKETIQSGAASACSWVSLKSRVRFGLGSAASEVWTDLMSAASALQSAHWPACARACSRSGPSRSPAA